MGVRRWEMRVWSLEFGDESWELGVGSLEFWSGEFGDESLEFRV